MMELWPTAPFNFLLGMIYQDKQIRTQLTMDPNILYNSWQDSNFQVLTPQFVCLE
jgi:hypothetical protein